MTVKIILTEPNKLLRQISQPVDHVGENEQKLMDDMIETMYAANGIGLAAIQIGFPKRIIVMDISKDEKKVLEIICNHLSDALVKKTLISNVKTKSKELSLKLLQLQTLFDISLAINSILDLGQLVDEILIRAVSILNGSSGFILLGDSTSPMLHIKTAFNLTSDDLDGKIFSRSSGELKKIWESNKFRRITVIF